MSHLSRERLARLVDEAPDALESRHLAACGACTDELDALRALATSLRELPAPAPAASAWPSLERRLETEGLIRRAPNRAVRGGTLLRFAAAIALLLTGGALGALAQARLDGATRTAGVAAPVATSPAVALERAEANYLDALARYADFSRLEEPADPYARLAALEGIVLTTRAALDAAPADPVINGYHLTALAQREATLRHLASGTPEPWF